VQAINGNLVLSVPEPSTIGAIGLLTLALQYRRRRSNRV
jgi:hypothetical protein